MKKFLKLLFLLGIFVLVGAACMQKPVPSANEAVPQIKTDKERAIEEAKKVFAEQKAAGVDMSVGPCLSNEIIPDWVADVAHWPRQAVDNNPANQCSAYREGKAHHFVELDQEGNFINAY
jgi:hypothetical protein